jgi:hypothetical protein
MQNLKSSPVIHLIRFSVYFVVSAIVHHLLDDSTPATTFTLAGFFSVLFVVLDARRDRKAQGNH